MTRKKIDWAMCDWQAESSADLSASNLLEISEAWLVSVNLVNPYQTYRNQNLCPKWVQNLQAFLSNLSANNFGCNGFTCRCVCSWNKDLMTFFMSPGTAVAWTIYVTTEVIGASVSIIFIQQNLSVFSSVLANCHNQSSLVCHSERKRERERELGIKVLKPSEKQNF